MANSTICQRFIQNAWKKELCSNCFKSKEEHVKVNGTSVSLTLTQIKSIQLLTNGIVPTSILKGKEHKSKNRSVSFPPEEFEVIGYGGDEYGSSDEEDGFFETSDDSNDEVLFPDGEDEKELHKLTKINTDFNSVTANLDDEKGGGGKKTGKKIHTPLELGKPLTDNEGKKQTLLVSVEPFSSSTTPPKRKTNSIKQSFENDDKKPTSLVNGVNGGSPIVNGVNGSSPIGNGVTPTIKGVNSGSPIAKGNGGIPIVNGVNGGSPIVNGGSPTVNGVNGGGPIVNGVNGGSPIVNGGSPTVNGVNGGGPIVNGVNGGSPVVNGVNGGSPVVNGVNGGGPIVNGVNAGSPIIEPVSNSIASSRKTHLFKLLDSNDDSNQTTVNNIKSFSVAENNLTNLILNQTLSQKNSDESKLYTSNIEVTPVDVILEPVMNGIDILPPPAFSTTTDGEMEEGNCTNVVEVIHEATPEMTNPSDVVKIVLEDKYSAAEQNGPPKEHEKDSKEIVLHPIVSTKTTTDVDEVDDRQNTNNRIKSNLRISLDDHSKEKDCSLVNKASNRKTQITRGTILTKVHEPIRTKKFLHLSAVDITDDIAFNEKTDNNLLKENIVYNGVDKKSLESVLTNNIKNNSNSNSPPKTPEKDSFNNEVAVTVGGAKMNGGVEKTKVESPEIKRDPIQLPLIINSSYSKINSTDSNKYSVSAVISNGHATGAGVSETTEKNGGKVVSSEYGGKLEYSSSNKIDSNLELESRELAGEPDGRADSDESSETTASPYVSISPQSPAANPRSSFLHGLTKDKPKVAVRPTSFSLHLHTEPLTALCEQFVTEQSLSQSLDYLSSEASLKKRQAPQPPPTPLSETKVEHNQQEKPVEQQIYCPPQKPKKNSLSEFDTKKVSMSYDNLSTEKTLSSPVVEKARKINGAATKMRFTLKKFMRWNSKEDDKVHVDSPPTPLSPKPRPEIIHPIDLNKSGVEVLRSDKPNGTAGKASPTTPTESSPQKKSGASAPGRPSKPPPPPRNPATTVRPARPPPPETNGTVYANVGEPRQNVAPTKPQRTASIKRENHMDYEPVQNKKFSWYEKENIYEPITVTNGMFDPRLNNNNVKSFEQESKTSNKSSEESSKSNSLRLSTRQNSVGQLCESTNVQPSSDTDNDVYYPYCFYSTDETNEDDGEKKKTRLRLRKGRSVVHKNLEDNYGAVIIANHEALAQVLDQLQLNPVIPPHFRNLSSSNKIQWNVFSNIDSTGRTIIADRLFYPAEWNSYPVTLCISPLQHFPCTLPQLYTLSPVIEFTDFVPAEYLTTNKIQNSEQVNVSVLSSRFFDSLTSYSASKPAIKTEKDIGLIVIQLVNVLKCLQTCDQVDISLQELVLCREEEESVPRLCVAPVSSDSSLLMDKGQERMSLCQAMVAGTEILLPSSPLSAVLKFVLKEEHASSLSQAKALVEFWLWGPADTSLSEDRQAALQRWLDLERATVLHGLVCSRNPQVSLMEHSHLMFLVRTNAKIMADSSYLLESYTT